MKKRDPQSADEKLLAELQPRFTALVGEMQAAMNAALALQQKVAAYASMFQAHGLPIPVVEGLKIQQMPLPPAAQAALMQAFQPQQGAPMLVPPPPVVPAPLANAGRLSARECVADVLRDSELTVAELIDQIEKKHRIRFAPPSVYRILGNKNLYESNGGKWRAKK